MARSTARPSGSASAPRRADPRYGLSCMTTPILIPSVSELHDLVGKPLGVSDWTTITQERIAAFAAATGDHQWIHTDVDRARRESPWKATIAHGYLTLSLAPVLLAQLVRVEGTKTVINTGADKVRLSSPVPAGSRVRMSAEIRDTRDVPGGGVRASIAVRFEVEGNAKPACMATVNYVYFA
jgi:acyl dehydratase